MPIIRDSHRTLLLKRETTVMQSNYKDSLLARERKVRTALSADHLIYLKTFVKVYSCLHVCMCWKVIL